MGLDTKSLICPSGKSVGRSAVAAIKNSARRAAARRIASSKMLLDNFPPMIGATSPNRVGVVDGGNDQHGRAARSGVGGNGALPVGQAGGEGKHPRRAVRDDGLASQACGARTP